MAKKIKAQRRKKMSKERMSKLKFAKIPVEIAYEDLMRHHARRGVPEFTFKEKKTKEGVVFTLFFQEPKKEVQYTAVSSGVKKEIKALRSMFKDYCKEINKEIKQGKFKKPDDGIIDAEVVKKKPKKKKK